MAGGAINADAPLYSWSRTLTMPQLQAPAHVDVSWPLGEQDTSHIVQERYD